MDIAIEELKPHYMRGFGTVPDDAVSELNGVVHQLRALVTGMERYLQEMNQDLDARLLQLERTGFDVVLLRLMEQIATRNGLVEFRLSIDNLVSRLEEDTFEVALFGRVSSGKSSLLNALLGTAVLPVGVNPITAIPTKLRYGNAPRVAVAYADGRKAQVSIQELSSLVTEQGNPGNSKNIVRAIVEVPSPRLQEGIMLVDTPGLGSLAKRGGAETLAYLPCCDLALLLVDAGATLNEEDLGTLRLLSRAGIPALVLLSKCDLLGNGDLGSAISYTEKQVEHELGISATVHPVSALSNYSGVLDRFFADDLLPRFEKARTLREASIARKIGALREAMMTAVEGNLPRERREIDRLDMPDLESVLRVVAGEVGEQHTLLDQEFRKPGGMPDIVLGAVATRAIEWIGSSSENQVSSLQLSEWIHGLSVGWFNPRWKVCANRAAGGRSAAGRRRENGPQRCSIPGGFRDHSAGDAALRISGDPRFHQRRLLEVPGRVSFATDGSQSGERIGAQLEQALYRYAIALSQWSEQTVRKLEALVNSYADAYRLQIQGIAGTTDLPANRAQLEADVEVLRNWTPLHA